MVAVFDCSWSTEDGRPEIDFEDLDNRKNDWLTIGEVIDGTRPVTDFPAVSVRVRHPDAIEWLKSQKYDWGKDPTKDDTL